MNTKSVVVIGAGIGGICAAIHLAKRGVHVTVVEKNSHPGGRCDQFSRDGHRFDTGPTLMVMRPLYETEFAAMGAAMGELMDLRRVDPTYHLVFDDESQLNLTSDMKSLSEQLEAFEPGAIQGLLGYMQEGHRHYHLGVDRLVDRDFRKATDFFNLGNFPLLFQVKPLANHYANMSHYFHNPRLKAAFTFQDMYMGLSPFDAPATFSMMPYTELAHGVWYPQGGMYRLVDALMALAQQAGVEFAYKTAVEQIEIAGGAAHGVSLAGGGRLAADVVLANADLPYVYDKLLPKYGLAEQFMKKRFSCSVISFFWGMDKPFPALGAHTLFLADEYRQSFDTIIKDLGLAVKSCIYVHAPARLDPSMAPAGQDTLIAIVPVGHLNADESQDWGAMRDQAREQVFRRLAEYGIGDIKEHIKFENTFTPLSWRKRYNLVKGSTHGLCHNLMQLGYLRPGNKHPRYQNLYFVGASTRPGTGLPTAMVSGRLTAQRIMDEMA